MKQNLCPAEKRHLLYLLFWPIFGIRYLLLENCQRAGGYYPVSCFLDEWIPFLEGFLIPYFLWHGCIIGMHIWLCCTDVPAFIGYSRYLIVSMSISTAIFLIWPTCQNLRPAVFPRENLLTEGVRLLYRLDTNTNVCPSEHVIGSVGFLLAALHCDRLRMPAKSIPIGAMAVLTASATVFLKQHSLVDVAAAIPVCVLGYVFSFYAGRSGVRGIGYRLWNRFLPGKFSA